MFGLPESGLADTLRDAEQRVDGFERLEITTCLRRGEIEMVTRYEPDAAAAYADLMALLRERHGGEIFSEDGSLRRRPGRGAACRAARIATAESCTAGLVAARLTDRPGSSAYVAGGVVAYANEAKSELLGVDPALIDAHGAVSEPVAEAMADGALRRFAADTAIAITGIAGPGGGTEEKPVGTVCFCVKLADGDDRRPHHAAARRPVRHSRAVDDRRDAPAAPRARAELRVRSASLRGRQEEYPMTAADERRELSELAVQAGWHCRDEDRTDYYSRSPVRVHVIWQGDDAISGGSLYHDDNLMAYTRDLTTVTGWLKR